VELHVDDFTLAVAAPCSGIRSLVALMAIAALFAYLLPASMPRRIGLFLAGIPVALIANTIRVTCIMLIAHHFGKKLALGFFHDYSSPFLFVLACLVLMGLWKALSCQDSGESPTT
jgi:exosortase/archaeosortase family protein